MNLFSYIVAIVVVIVAIVVVFGLIFGPIYLIVKGIKSQKIFMNNVNALISQKISDLIQIFSKYLFNEKLSRLEKASHICTEIQNKCSATIDEENMVYFLDVLLICPNNKLIAKDKINKLDGFNPGLFQFYNFAMSNNLYNDIFLHAEKMEKMELAQRLEFLYGKINSLSCIELLEKFSLKYAVKRLDKHTGEEYFTIIDDDAFNKFKTVMQDQGVMLTDYDLEIIVNDITQKHYFDTFCSIMETENNSSYDEYLEKFLNVKFDFFMNKYNDIELLEKLLLMKDFNINNLDNDLRQMQQRFSLDFFKHSLEKNEHILIIDVDNMNGIEFENFLVTLYKRLSYSVTKTSVTGDQGADLILAKYNKKYVVQAKRYSSKVGNSAIQEIVAAIKHYNANTGIVVTNNYFTQSAIALAKSNNIILIDRDKLTEMINNFN